MRRLVAISLALVGAACGSSSHEVALSPSVPEVAHAVPATMRGAAIAPARAPIVETTPSACSDGMALVDGDYCTEVEQRCLRWLDPPGRYEHFRCAEYASPAVCRGKKRHVRACVDVDEQHHAGESLPDAHVTFSAAEKSCAERGARLCSESEWELACEGPEMRPYPYGFSRDSTACNVDKTELGRPGHGLHDLRASVGADERCVSAYGVRDLVGNVEEWAQGDEGSRTRFHKETLLMGSWWMPGRSTCRGVNAGHERTYEGPETGYRCCADARDTLVSEPIRDR